MPNAVSKPVIVLRDLAAWEESLSCTTCGSRYPVMTLVLGNEWPSGSMYTQSTRLCSTCLRMLKEEVLAVLTARVVEVVSGGKGVL